MTHTEKASPAMKSPKTAKELLDIYFLDMRSALLETAAALDRIQRADEGDEIFDDPRMQRLNDSLDTLTSREAGRAERFLRLLSVPSDI